MPKDGKKFVEKAQGAVTQGKTCGFGFESNFLTFETCKHFQQIEKHGEIFKFFPFQKAVEKLNKPAASGQTLHQTNFAKKNFIVSLEYGKMYSEIISTARKSKFGARESSSVSKVKTNSS